MKMMIKIGVILAGLILFLGPVKDFLIQSAVVAGARSVAGVDVKMGYFSLSFLQQSIKIRDVKVYNPDGFPTDKVMVDIPEIAVKVDIMSIFQNTLHLPYMRLDLKEARVIKNKAGALNVNSLKFAQQPGKPGQAKGAQSQQGVKKASPKDMKMKLDLVLLNIGTIYIEDYTSGKERPKLTVLNLNLKNSEFKDVTSPVELGSLIMFQALTPAGLDGAFSLGSNLLGKTMTGAGSVVDAVGGILKSFRKDELMVVGMYPASILSIIDKP